MFLQLGQGLLAECQSLGIHMIELGGNQRTAFRFCPLEHAAGCPINYPFLTLALVVNSQVDHVQRFVRQLTDVLRIVDSTVMARARFTELREEYPSLTFVPVKKWAGVGAICYIPSIVKEIVPGEWNENQRQQVERLSFPLLGVHFQISHLNIELVHQLRAFDSAFSSGESELYGVIRNCSGAQRRVQVKCVKFGMLSDAKDLNDLMKMVAEKGKEIENSQQFLDSLADMIRHGIETANEDLKKENDIRLQNEGVIRQLPIMGSLYNWFSPLDKEAVSIRGRSFNLKTGQSCLLFPTVPNLGEIQATDVLYKLKHNDVKEPMTPVETPQNPHDFSKRVVEPVPEEDESADTEAEGEVKTEQPTESK